LKEGGRLTLIFGYLMDLNLPISFRSLTFNLRQQTFLLPHLRRSPILRELNNGILHYYIALFAAGQNNSNEWQHGSLRTRTGRLNKELHFTSFGVNHKFSPLAFGL
jgi:hypothetical protein